jgi:hypothetical protein
MLSQGRGHLRSSTSPKSGQSLVFLRCFVPLGGEDKFQVQFPDCQMEGVADGASISDYTVMSMMGI